VRQATVDGKAADPGALPFHDDGRTHVVEIVLGRETALDERSAPARAASGSLALERGAERG
jgi:hypothetical protein